MPAARTLPPLALMLVRGFRKRCPRCGRSGLFRRWFQIVESCPGCGLRFEREEGAWLASAVVNMGATQLVVVAFIVVSLVLTLPEPPVVVLVVGGAGLTAAFAAWFQPRAKTFWVAIELFLRSGAREDLADVERFDARP